MQRLLCLLLLLIGLKSSAQQTDAATLVRLYVQARNQTLAASADARSIDSALAFCTDDFVYEHPAAQAKIEGKDRVRAGMMGYIGSTKDPHYEIHILADRPDVVVAQVEQRFRVKQDDGSWKPGQRSNLTVFEISNGKIRRIIDY